MLFALIHLRIKASYLKVVSDNGSGTTYFAGVMAMVALAEEPLLITGRLMRL